MIILSLICTNKENASDGFKELEELLRNENIFIRQEDSMENTFNIYYDTNDSDFKDTAYVFVSKYLCKMILNEYLKNELDIFLKNKYGHITKREITVIKNMIFDVLTNKNIVEDMKTYEYVPAVPYIPEYDDIPTSYEMPEYENITEEEREPAMVERVIIGNKYIDIITSILDWIKGQLNTTKELNINKFITEDSKTVFDVVEKIANHVVLNYMIDKESSRFETYMDSFDEDEEYYTSKIILDIHEGEYVVEDDKSIDLLEYFVYTFETSGLNIEDLILKGLLAMESEIIEVYSKEKFNNNFINRLEKVFNNKIVYK